MMNNFIILLLIKNNVDILNKLGIELQNINQYFSIYLHIYNIDCIGMQMLCLIKHVVCVLFQICRYNVSTSSTFTKGRSHIGAASGLTAAALLRDERNYLRHLKTPSSRSYSCCRQRPAFPRCTRA